MLIVVVVVIVFVVVVTAVWNSLSNYMVGGGICCVGSGSCGNSVCGGSIFFHQPHH